MAKSKLEQYNQSFKKALGITIPKLLPGMADLTITDVLIDPSLQHGRVWLKTSPETLAAIQEKRVDIQNSLQRVVKTRFTPKLEFVIDDNYLERMESLFASIERPSDDNNEN